MKAAPRTPRPPRWRARKARSGAGGREEPPRRGRGDLGGSPRAPEGLRRGEPRRAPSGDETEHRSRHERETEDDRQPGWTRRGGKECPDTRRDPEHERGDREPEH